MNSICTTKKEANKKHSSFFEPENKDGCEIENVCN